MQPQPLSTLSKSESDTSTGIQQEQPLSKSELETSTPTQQQYPLSKSEPETAGSTSREELEETHQQGTCSVC